MRVMRRLSGLIWLFVVAVMSIAEPAVAQIRIIPQSKIDSIKSPATVAVKAMAFRDGYNLSFGCIAEQDGVWTKRFEWQNVSDRPLVITRVSSSCSCLKVVADRTPVKEGGVGSVTLNYDPRNRSGKVLQRVMIYTNLSDKVPTVVLNLEGEVRSMAYRGGDYPYLRGELALRRDTVRVMRDEAGEVRIACMNVGKRVLHIAADTLLSSRGVELYTEPRELHAGEEGDLVVRFDPKAIASERVLRLYIGGLPLPPRQRSLVLQIEE